MGLTNAFGDLALDTTTQQTNTRVSALQQILQPLQRIAQLLKPLGVTSSGTNRIQIDINSLPTLANVTTVNTINTVTTVTTVGTVSNQSLVGGTNAFAQVQALARIGYSNAIRGKIS